jgi:predicted GIY-YIG superfamily endonuclease
MAALSIAIPPELLGNVERYAVYRCFSDQGELLYIGETGDLGKRFADHAKKLWFVQVRGITLEWYADELDALNAERRAIHVEHPKYNVVHRNSASIQPAKPQVKRKEPAMPVTARSWEETREIVLGLMRNDPDITASEVGRRLGKTDGRGRQVMRRIVAEQGAGLTAISSRPGAAGSAGPLPRGRGPALSRGAAPRGSRARESRARDFTPSDERAGRDN